MQTQFLFVRSFFVALAIAAPTAALAQSAETTGGETSRPAPARFRCENIAEGTRRDVACTDLAEGSAARVRCERERRDAATETRSARAR